MFDLNWDSHTTGLTFFNGPHKLCNVTTRHNQGLVRSGDVVMEPMPRSAWTIHCTSAVVNVDLLAAIIAAIPPDADSAPSCRRAV